MTRDVSGTHQKALQINLDPSKYGSFAEIGAGQEVARWFFRVGGAAGTIAKAMSAYDMKFSDEIYGPCERYVSRQRLQTMLDHEYGLLVQRLDAQRGANTRFFAFANTVAARSFKRQEDGHGWLGIRFQGEPQGQPSQIIIHVRLLDHENVAQQEVLGILGVNVVYGAIYHHRDPAAFVMGLMDDLSTERVEVDMIEFSGPSFARVDNRLMSLMLVQQGFTNAAMFTADGEVVQPSDALYKKAILVERGTFRPITKLTLDLLSSAQASFLREPKVQNENVVVLMEMTLKLLADGDKIDHQDFLDRIDILGTLGKTVLVTNYFEYHRLAAYLFRYTSKMIGIAMGVPALRQVFEEKYYTDLKGGILESFGRLFKNDLKFYVYPTRDPDTGDIVTAQTLQVAPHLRHLYRYLLENHFIEPLTGIDESCLPIFTQDVLARLRAGDHSWESMVPEQVANTIKERGLFSYRA